MSLSEESQFEDLNLKKRKKGMKNLDYRCEQIKKARVKNEQYVNWKGNVVAPKPHGIDCR